jgi:hypothetical protein
MLLARGRAAWDLHSGLKPWRRSTLEIDDYTHELPYSGRSNLKPVRGCRNHTFNPKREKGVNGDSRTNERKPELWTVALIDGDAGARVDGSLAAAKHCGISKSVSNMLETASLASVVKQ